jgi:hypothetical protein
MLYDRFQPQFRQPCSYARTFADIVDKTIFSQVSALTTPAQFDLALQNLRALAKRLEAGIDLFHYPQAYGSPHSCVRDLLNDSEFRLMNLAVMHQKVQPPAPKHQLITTDGAVIDLEEKIETNRQETDLGTEDSPFDNWDNQ